ncbi:hypothetical protein FDH08_gp51 [Propionibacterium phage B22]|uniref:Uncharacterized protein n=1 Tax=Propionibacterium phage B22 TaxID=1897532 RepID=A0A1D8ETN2_9CAUD|nr:hypothetical protein FDH08_gp51 [Propionibacterium phage B22]AOT24402.1 hypothetical protein B22_51 [Propionibacterium phage B22]CEH08718.1 Protein of unknown function [Propionibacterium freudenreichii]
MSTEWMDELPVLAGGLVGGGQGLESLDVGVFTLRCVRCGHEATETVADSTAWPDHAYDMHTRAAAAGWRDGMCPACAAGGHA